MDTPSPSATDDEQSRASSPPAAREEEPVPEVASSPDYDLGDEDQPRVLFVKLKEAQYEASSAKAEVARLKAQAVVLESSARRADELQVRLTQVSLRLPIVSSAHWPPVTD